MKDLKQYVAISETCHHKINELKVQTQTEIIHALNMDPVIWERSIIRCLVKKNEEVNKFIDGEYDMV